MNELIEKIVSPPPVDAGTNRPPEIPKDNGSSPGADITGGALAAVAAKKRGRHPKTCQCPNCLAKGGGKVDSGETGKPGDSAAVIALDRETCKTAIAAMTKVLDLTGIIVIEKEISKLSFLSAGDRSTFLDKVPMRPEVRDGIVLSGTACAEKYGATKFMPEIALGGFLLAYAGGIGMLVREIRALGTDYEKSKNQPIPENGAKS